MALLDARTVSKSFGGLAVLSNVSLEVGADECAGLVGPNGAGKTTLFNCLLGLVKPDRGEIRFDGHDLAGLPIYRRARLGIGRTFQRLELFPDLTSRQHLLVAERARHGRGSLLQDLMNRGGPDREERRRAAAMIELLGIGDVADAPAQALSLGHGRLVELGRALMTEPALLLLDEPSSGLDRIETAALATVLERVRSERGTAILLVEHDLEMVQRLVSRLYVLDVGRLIADGPTAAVMADPAVREAYLGRAS
ncbi:MAG: ABC transporter ATP-binding protein [Acidimicrobiales bacterium]